MNPSDSALILPDKLVEDKVLGDEPKPLMTGLYIRQVYVGSLTGTVLGVGRTAHSLVEPTAAVAAGDNDRHTGMLPQRFKHLLTETLQIGDSVDARLVADAKPHGGSGTGELVKREMFRQHILHWITILDCYT